MRKGIQILLLLLICTTFSSIVMAHPGHGKEAQGFSLNHYLTEPVHFMAGIMVLAGCISAVILGINRGIFCDNKK